MKTGISGRDVHEWIKNHEHPTGYKTVCYFWDEIKPKYQRRMNGLAKIINIFTLRKTPA